MEAARPEADDKYTALWEKYKENGGVEARNDVVLAYIELVKRIVLKFKGCYNNYGQLDDMINQGMIALIDSVEKFDSGMGNKFETFASLKIKGAVIDFMRKQDWIPRNQRSLVKELNTVYDALYAEHGREPDKEEISARMGIDTEQLEKILQKRRNAMILSYEEAINEKMMTAFPLLTEQKDADAPEAEMLKEELNQQLTAAVGELGKQERLVISLYYYEDLKLREIADVMGVTESRVSQVHSAAIMKLRHKIKPYADD